MFYKSLQNEDENFKIKSIVGQQYNSSNGSSATFGNSRSTGSFRLWTSFACNLNSSSAVTLALGQTVKSSILYNRINSIIQKYTGSFRPSSQQTFNCILFDKDAFGDSVSANQPGTFITSNSLTFTVNTSLSGNDLYNAKNYVPIMYGAIQVGLLFPRQGVFVNFNQAYTLGGNTIVFWAPVYYKAEAYYFRRLGCKQFNFSNNPSFSAESLTRTFITTIGLYGQRDKTSASPTTAPLLAVAKLITPCKKNDETDYLFKVNLQY